MNRISKLKKVVTVKDIDIQGRRQELSHPTKDFTTSEVVLSNLIRGLEVTMGIRSAKKVITDSDYLRTFKGKRVVFVGDIAKFDLDNFKVTLLNLTVVGEDNEGTLTQIPQTNSTLVAEKYDFDLSVADFTRANEVAKNHYSKLLLGTTVMFSAIVGDNNELSGVRLNEFGLRLFLTSDLSSGVDSLAILTDDIETYNYEYATLKDGVLSLNVYRNTSLDEYIKHYMSDGSKSHLFEASEYILKTLDSKTRKLNKIVGLIAKP